MIGCHHTINRISNKSWNTNLDVSAIGLVLLPLNNRGDPAILFNAIYLPVLKFITAVLELKIQVIWGVTPYRLVEDHRRFQEP